MLHAKYIIYLTRTLLFFFLIKKVCVFYDFFFFFFFFQRNPCTVDQKSAGYTGWMWKITDFFCKDES